MNGKAAGYWVCTGLVGFVMFTGGIAHVARLKENVEGFVHFGYPIYFMTILGVWKILGAIAILAPGFPRVKEWAYAGIFIDLTSATASHASVGDSVGHIVAPLVFAGILAGSWALRPPSRVLGTLFPAKG